MNTPSIKTLRAVFGDNARQAKRVLCMTRAELEQTPGGSARRAECYNPPCTGDMRMYELNRLAEAYGVESFQLRGGGYCEYLNAGDTYAPTLVRMPGGRYRVTSLGDIAEKYATA